jgi:hypothetical protein
MKWVSHGFAFSNLMANPGGSEFTVAKETLKISCPQSIHLCLMNLEIRDPKKILMRCLNFYWPL